MSAWVHSPRQISHWLPADFGPGVDMSRITTWPQEWVTATGESRRMYRLVTVS